MTTCGTGCGLGGWGGPLPGDPSNDIVLSATAAFGGIDLTWSYPTTNPFAVSYIKVFRGTTPNLSSAVKVKEVTGSHYFDKLAAITTYYYWIQVISINGTVSASVGPANATSRLSIEETIQNLTGIIDAGLLSTALRSKIDEISVLNSNLSNEVFDRERGEISLATAMQEVANGVALAHTYVINETNTRTSQNSAIAEKINGVVVTLGGDIAGVTTTMGARIDKTKGIVDAQVVTKLTVNGLVGGFGVYNDGVGVEAGFDVDKFWVGRTTTDKVKPFIIDRGIVYISEAVIPILSAGKINTNGLSIRTTGGVTLFSEVVPLTAANITPDTGWLNSNLVPSIQKAAASNNLWVGSLSTPTGNLSGGGISQTSYPDSRSTPTSSSTTAVVVRLPVAPSYVYWRIFDQVGRPPGWYTITMKFLVVSGMSIIFTATQGSSWADSMYQTISTTSAAPVWVTGRIRQYVGVGKNALDVVVGSYHNGAPISSSPSYTEVAVCDLFVYADASIQDLGYSGAMDATSDLTLVASSNMKLAGNTATKVGSNGDWNEQVYSRDGFTGGAYASAVCAAGTDLMFGLNTDTDRVSSASYNSLDYAIYATKPGGRAVIYVYESGTGHDIGVHWVIGDLLAVVYDGVSVRYLKNGVVVYTSTTPPVANTTFYFDSSFYGVGDSISNIRFGPMSNNDWSATGGAGKPADNASRVVDLGDGTQFGSRNHNDTPQEYASKGAVRHQQFKQSSVVGLTGAALYCTLETLTQYTDSSGGRLIQYAYADVKTFRRNGNIADNTWSTWVIDLDRNSYTGDLNATQNQSDTVTNNIIGVAGTTANWSGIVNNDGNRPDNGSTRGAPSGTTVAGIAADSVGQASLGYNNQVKTIWVPGSRDYFYPVLVATTVMPGAVYYDVTASRPYVHADGNWVGSYTCQVYARGFAWGHAPPSLIEVDQITGSGTYTSGLSNVYPATGGGGIILMMRGGMTHYISMSQPIGNYTVTAYPGAYNDGLVTYPVESTGTLLAYLNRAYCPGAPVDFGTSVGGVGKPENNATVGATWGSNLSGQPADSALLNSYAVATAAADATAKANAAQGAAIASANAGLAQRLVSNGRNVLAGAGGFATGSLAWDTNGNRTSGYGIGFTQNGLVAYSPNSSQPMFTLNGTTGAATFGGDLTAPTGTFGTVTIAAGGSLSSGQSNFNTGTGYWLGLTGGVPKFSIGNPSGPRMTWDGSDLVINSPTFDTLTVTAGGTFPNFTASVSGGKAPYQYAWILQQEAGFEYGRIWVDSGITAASCHVALGPGATGGSGSGSLVLIVKDSNGRASFAAKNLTFTSYGDGGGLVGAGD